MSAPSCSIVVAASTNDVIGDAGRLPWRIRRDLAEFRRRTLGGVVVAGRATAESIAGYLGQALPDRLTIVVTGDRGYAAAQRTEVVHSYDAARARARAVTRERGLDEYFVIGGVSVYRQALPDADRVHLTRVHAHVPGDATLDPGWLTGFTRSSASDTHTEGPLTFAFETWTRP